MAVTSIITKTSAENFGLEGRRYTAYAITKAPMVIIGGD